MGLMDLHTHTLFSDGKDTPEELIKYAIRRGITKLGITDHFDTIKCPSVSKEKLTEYMDILKELKEKYKSQIEVMIGLEICMDKALSQVEDLPYSQVNQLDYVLFEYVDDEYGEDPVTLEELHRYVENVQCKVGLAHTDLLEVSRIYGLEKTLQMIKDMGLFWEINVSYPYSNDFIEENQAKEVIEMMDQLKSYQIEITVGSDTHDTKERFEPTYYQRLLRANKLINVGD